MSPLVRRAAAPVLVPLAGLGLAWLGLRLAEDTDLAGSVLAYALALLPLGALVSAGAARLTGRRRIAGALVAVAAGLAAAQLLAMVRFYHAGATGFLSLAAAPYTAEVLMVVGALPVVAWVGASVAGARWERGAGAALAVAAGAGAVLAPVVGVGLVATRLVATVPFLDPVVQWLVVVVAVTAAGTRRARPD